MLGPWADAVEIPVTWVGRERRFSTLDIDAMKAGPAARERLEGLDVRGSGSTGQEPSLAAQEAELRGTSTGTAVRAFKDLATGLREHRPGPGRLFTAAAAGVSVVRVTREDRLAGSGARRLRQLLAAHDATLESAHPKKAGGWEELLKDFTSLVTTFDGRLYGLRSATVRRRLLTETCPCTPAGASQLEADR